MKKFLVPLLALMLVAAVSVPPASADRGWEGRDRGAPHEFHNGGAFLGGLLLGGVLGGILGAPYAAPPPVYVTPPPACYTQPGYWTQVPHVRPDGYTTYHNVWVPPRTVCQ